MAKRVEPFFAESSRATFKAEVGENERILIDVRVPGTLVIMSLSQEDAINLMEWLSRATA